MSGTRNGWAWLRNRLDGISLRFDRWRGVRLCGQGRWLTCDRPAGHPGWHASRSFMSRVR